MLEQNFQEPQMDDYDIDVDDDDADEDDADEEPNDDIEELILMLNILDDIL